MQEKARAKNRSKSNQYIQLFRHEFRKDRTGSRKIEKFIPEERGGKYLEFLNEELYADQRLSSEKIL